MAKEQFRAPHLESPLTVPEDLRNKARSWAKKNIPDFEEDSDLDQAFQQFSGIKSELIELGRKDVSDRDVLDIILEYNEGCFPYPIHHGDDLFSDAREDMSLSTKIVLAESLLNNNKYPKFKITKVTKKIASAWEKEDQKLET
ncbi:MAG: hypothetical protein PHU71_02880 [Candidatus Gracilibacteria bacterium]|nr:hypothetical protein [Candidatus Gracilibacteria bacterium]